MTKEEMKQEYIRLQDHTTNSQLFYEFVDRLESGNWPNESYWILKDELETRLKEWLNEEA